MTAVLWVVGVLAAWTGAGLVAALVTCRAIRIADEKEAARTQAAITASVRAMTDRMDYR